MRDDRARNWPRRRTISATPSRWPARPAAWSMAGGPAAAVGCCRMQVPA